MTISTSHWLTDPHSEAIYAATTGPYQSPDPFECWLLSKLATDAEVVLEIGSWKGRSGCFLWKGLTESNRPRKRLICVDWFKGDDTGGEGADRAALETAFTRFGVQAEVVESDMHAVDWDALLGTDKIDLLFYDSVHLTRPFVEVVTKLHPYLNPHARVAVHDSYFPDSVAAVGQLVASGLYRKAVEVAVWEGFCLLQRN